MKPTLLNTTTVSRGYTLVVLPRFIVVVSLGSAVLIVDSITTVVLASSIVDLDLSDLETISLFRKGLISLKPTTSLEPTTSLKPTCLSSTTS